MRTEYPHLLEKIRTLYTPKRQELIRFLKFCVVGTIGTAIYFGLFNLLYNVLQLHQVLSALASNSAAVVNNYTWSRFWVYPETRHQHGARKFVQFVVVSAIAVALNTAILWATDHWVLGHDGLLRALVAPIAAWLGVAHRVLSSNGAAVIATGIVLFWNFFANRMWTFRDVDLIEGPLVETQGPSQA
jgi:putative flippase GtrA